MSEFHKSEKQSLLNAIAMAKLAKAKNFDLNQEPSLETDPNKLRELASKGLISQEVLAANLASLGSSKPTKTFKKRK